jgi:hypothetical protein
LAEGYLNPDGVGRNALMLRKLCTSFLALMHVVMYDGTESETGPGDYAVIPPGHTAWVIGIEPCISIEFTGAKDYAKQV